MTKNGVSSGTNLSKYLNCYWLSQPKQSATNKLHWANIKLYWPYVLDPKKRMNIITAESPAIPGMNFEKPYIRVSLRMVYIEICWFKPVYLILFGNELLGLGLIQQSYNQFYFWSDSKRFSLK